MCIRDSLKGMSEGSYEVPVSIEIPKGYELVDEVTTGVEISKISTADEMCIRDSCL